MIRTQKITALFCALVLAVSSFGTYTDNAKAAGLPVTSDDAPLSRETAGKGSAKSTGIKTNAQHLRCGKKVQEPACSSYYLERKCRGNFRREVQDRSTR